MAWGLWGSMSMTRPILMTLALLALAATLSVGLLHAQRSDESERAPYRIDLLPGWNLISFPGDPVDTALESVIGPDLQADVILAFQDGEWLTAWRDTEGRVTGTLTTMLGSWGYWVRTPAAETIETTLSTAPLTQGPPYCYIPHGWQIIGVWDAEHRTPGTRVDADSNFSLKRVPWIVSWKVAHGFDTAANRWETPIRPGTGATIEVGAAYWVWATGPALLCP